VKFECMYYKKASSLCFISSYTDPNAKSLESVCRSPVSCSTVRSRRLSSSLSGPRTGRCWSRVRTAPRTRSRSQKKKCRCSSPGGWRSRLIFAYCLWKWRGKFRHCRRTCVWPPNNLNNMRQRHNCQNPWWLQYRDSSRHSLWAACGNWVREP